ncbi:hypothetical protein WDW37_15300 [Bdellovibrionota bacterium FG-1]
MKQVKNFLRATGVWSFMMAVAIFTQAVAHADESISKIALNVQQKEVLVKFMKGRIARHKMMRNSGEIIADLSQVVAKNREMVGKNGVDLASFDKGAGLAIDSIKAIGDKDILIAMEGAELQRIMQSGNYLFFLTRIVWDDCYDPIADDSNQGREQQCIPFSAYGSPASMMPYSGALGIGMASLVSIVTIPFDIIGLVPEFFISAVTGF